MREALDSQQPSFIAVYGRRRIGKIFLIRNFCNDTFTFQATGIANVSEKVQMGNFYSSLVRDFPQLVEKSVQTDWFGMFRLEWIRF